LFVESKLIGNKTPLSTAQYSTLIHTYERA